MTSPHTFTVLSPLVVGTRVVGVDFSGVYQGVRASEWDGEPVHFFTDGIIGTTPQGCFAFPVASTVTRCPGCDQDIAVTDTTECGGVDNGACCVVIDDQSEPCPFCPDGHDPQLVALAQAAHVAAFAQTR